jgi:DNA-binding SARP family transcriptional activator
VQLLGGLRLRNGDIVIGAISRRDVAALLARLALQPQRDHAREELAALLWPEAAHEQGLNRLRNALSTLRTLLDLPTAPGTQAILADRRCVRLNASGAAARFAWPVGIAFGPGGDLYVVDSFIQGPPATRQATCSWSSPPRCG